MTPIADHDKLLPKPAKGVCISLRKSDCQASVAEAYSSHHTMSFGSTTKVPGKCAPNHCRISWCITSSSSSSLGFSSAVRGWTLKGVSLVSMDIEKLAGIGPGLTILSFWTVSCHNPHVVRASCTYPASNLIKSAHFSVPQTVR